MLPWALLDLGSLVVHFVKSAWEAAKNIEVHYGYITPSIAGVYIGNAAHRDFRIEPGQAIDKTYAPNLPGMFQIEVRWGNSGDGGAPRSGLIRTFVGGLLGNKPGVVRTFQFTGREMEIAVDLK